METFGGTDSAVEHGAGAAGRDADQESLLRAPALAHTVGVHVALELFLDDLGGEQEGLFAEAGKLGGGEVSAFACAGYLFGGDIDDDEFIG